MKIKGKIKGTSENIKGRELGGGETVESRQRDEGEKQQRGEKQTPPWGYLPSHETIFGKIFTLPYLSSHETIHEIRE